MMTYNSFTAEIRVFERHREEWLHSHLGEYVAIQGNIVVEGFFDTYAEAFEAGLGKFGVRRCFLVKQIWITEPAYFVS